jgi:hypothetical protein
MTPDLLAEAVLKHGGLIHNAHPNVGEDGRDQFDYKPAYASVITNTEMGPDVFYYDDRTSLMNWEHVLREFLGRGGKTGFVSGTDTHEGHPAARTAVLARELTRDAVFDALRRRRTYAISNARILLDFRINGHCMGEEIEIEGKPRIAVDVKGTGPIDEVVVVRDGVEVRYVRVAQADQDAYGNPSRAWSSPIWVKRGR